MFLWLLLYLRDYCFFIQYLWLPHLPRHHCVDEASPLPSVGIHLKQFKYDQLRRGVDVFLGQSDLSTCLVKEIIHYILLRNPSARPLFQLADRSLLMKAAFVGHVRSALIAYLYIHIHCTCSITIITALIIVCSPPFTMIDCRHYSPDNFFRLDLPRELVPESL